MINIGDFSFIGKEVVPGWEFGRIKLRDGISCSKEGKGGFFPEVGGGWGIYCRGGMIVGLLPDTGRGFGAGGLRPATFGPTHPELGARTRFQKWRKL